MYTPKVSIGLPVYNGEKYLRVALDSILQQDYTDFELILSDNASDDMTGAICRGYAEKDRRVRYHRFEVNQGAARNFGAVFEMARGKYFKWAAYDDICLPGFLRKCVQTLDQAASSVVVAVPRMQLIDENGQPRAYPVRPESSDIRMVRPHQRLARVLRTVYWAPGQYGLIRSEALRKTRLIEPFVESDYPLIAELALLGEIWEIPEVLLQLRVHPQTSIRPYQKGESEVLSWFDPSKRARKKLVPQHTRMGLEYVRSVSRIELPYSERLRCYLTIVLVWCPIEVRRLIQELRNKIALGTRIKRFVGRWSSQNCRKLLKS
jgi:glycosyltransferase involved in cell wall biosynthesis